MKSLLADLGKDDVIEEPFPHIVAKDVLAADDLRRLIDEFPPLDAFPDYTTNDNVRLTFPVASARLSDDVSPFWKAFLASNATGEQIRDFFRIFGEHFINHHPRAEGFAKRAGELKVGLQHHDTFDDNALLVSSAIDVNTPIKNSVSSVRGPHVDSAHKPWFALFYLRDEEESEGGDLELYRLRQGQTLVGNIFNGSHVKQAAVEHVKTIKYEANTLFIGINGPHAIHGVSPRQPTPHARKFVTFNCEIPRRLF